MNDDTLVIAYGTAASPVTAIRALLASGFNQGNWNGTGIDSTAAQANFNSLRALGYVDSGTSLIVKYTSYGDNNLDGTVDVNDFRAFIDGLVTFNASAWSQGDYTYDNQIDLGNDFNLFLRSYIAQGGSLGELSVDVSQDKNLTMAQKAYVQSMLGGSRGASAAALPAAPISIPEPGTAVVLLVMAPAILGRRRRR